MNSEKVREQLERLNAENERLKALLIEAEGTLSKYADEEYNGYNADGKYARSTLTKLHAAGIGD